MPGFSGLAGVRSFYVPPQTQAFGTAIADYIAPTPSLRTKLALLKYTAQGTAHTVYVMRPLAKTTVYADAIAGATSLVITRDPGNYSANATADQKQFTPSVANNLIASGDYHLFRKPDGTFVFGTNSGATTNANGTVTLTVSALPTGGVKAGADFWFFGVFGDTNPADNRANPGFLTGTGAAFTFGDGSSSLVESYGVNEPLAIYSANGTAAGTLNQASGFYGP